MNLYSTHRLKTYTVFRKKHISMCDEQI